MGLSGHADPAAVLGVTISFTIIAVLVVVLRLYSRIFLVHSPGKDDAFIVAAAAMTVCLTIAQGFQGMHPFRPTPNRPLDSRLTSNRSKIWHGTASGQPDRLRAHHIPQTVLGQHCHLQLGTLPDQILHPATIPPHLPIPHLSNPELLLDGIHLRLVMLDSLQLHLLLQTRRLLLGQVYRRGHLSQPMGSLVSAPFIQTITVQQLIIPYHTGSPTPASTS